MCFRSSTRFLNCRLRRTLLLLEKCRRKPENETTFPIRDRVGRFSDGGLALFTRFRSKVQQDWPGRGATTPRAVPPAERPERHASRCQPREREQLAAQGVSAPPGYASRAAGKVLPEQRAVQELAAGPAGANPPASPSLE